MFFWLNLKVNSIWILLLLNIHRFLIFYYSNISVKLTIISHSKESIDKSSSACKVELLNLKQFLLSTDIPYTNLLLAASNQSIFLDSLSQENDMFTMRN